MFFVWFLIYLVWFLILFGNDGTASFIFRQCVLPGEGYIDVFMFFVWFLIYLVWFLILFGNDGTANPPTLACS